MNAGSSSVLILRLKRAESAIADGRLDEAFDIVQSDDIKQHRNGQRLIGQLARAFTKRGRENLDAERIQSALADCNKAEKLAGRPISFWPLRCCLMSSDWTMSKASSNRPSAIALSARFSRRISTLLLPAFTTATADVE